MYTEHDCSESTKQHKITDIQRSRWINIQSKLRDKLNNLANLSKMSSSMIIVRGSDCLVIINQSGTRIFSRGYVIINFLYYILYKAEFKADNLKNFENWDVSPEFWREEECITGRNIDDVTDGMEELTVLCDQELLFQYSEGAPQVLCLKSDLWHTINKPFKMTSVSP